VGVEENTFRVWVDNPERKTPPGRNRPTWGDNIRIGLKNRIGCCGLD
jgi:hypothetical protein